MGILDFLKDKFGSAASGTVTTKWVTPETYEYTGESNTMPIPEIKAGGIVKVEDIKLVNISTVPPPDFNYIGINAKAEMAKQLRDNPLLNAILDELKEFNLVQLLNTKEGEKESREDLYRKIKTIDDIRVKIEKYIKNAESVKKREEAKKNNYGVV